MSEIQDRVFQTLHENKIETFGYAEHDDQKVVAIALPFEADQALREKLAAIPLLPGWGLVIQELPIPEHVKTLQDERKLEQKLVRMPNREERRKYEKSRVRK